MVGPKVLTQVLENVILGINNVAISVFYSLLNNEGYQLISIWK